MVQQDFIIGILNILKTKWSLSPPFDVGGIKFTTGLYQEQLGTPQVCVTPLVEPYKLLNIGNQPIYYVNHVVQIHVWVRPPTESSSALGKAKNTRYQLSQEIERILRANATVVPGIQFVRMNEQFAREIMGIRPPLLGIEMRANLLDFRRN